MTLVGVWFLKTGYGSLDWPRVEGVVVSTTVETWTPVAEPDEAAPVPQYYPKIEYRYEVNGKSYVSTRYGLGETAKKYKERSDAQLAAAKYQISDPIEVRYDPNAPDQAVLHAGASLGAWVPLLLGVFFGGLGWFLSRFAEQSDARKALRTRAADA